MGEQMCIELGYSGGRYIFQDKDVGWGFPIVAHDRGDEAQCHAPTFKECENILFEEETGCTHEQDLSLQCDLYPHQGVSCEYENTLKCKQGDLVFYDSVENEDGSV